MANSRRKPVYAMMAMKKKERAKKITAIIEAKKKRPKKIREKNLDPDISELSENIKGNNNSYSLNNRHGPGYKMYNDDKYLPRKFGELLQKTKDIKNNIRKKSPKKPADADTRSQSFKTSVSSLSIMPNESLREFSERVNVVASEEIASAMKKSRKKPSKRPSHKSQTKKNDSEEVSENMKDKVSFGDVVQAPPQNLIVPRIVKKKKLSHKKSLYEQKALEEERERVIQHYRNLKKGT